MPTPKRSSKSKKKPRSGLSWLRVLLVLILTIGIVSTAGASGFVLGTIRSMPSIDVLDPQLKETSFLYDKDDNLITRLYGEQNRIPASFEEIPDDMLNAIVAIEDERFWNHFGLDLKGIARALWKDVQPGGSLQGASTITQQLARNAWPEEIGRERTIRRKIQEAVLAIQLERRYTKEEIVTMYLNTVYFGHSAYGVKAAAHVYFGKEVEDLTLGEAALLAGLPQMPEVHSPFKNMDRAKKRQQQVLNRMVANGYITEQQAQAAHDEKFELADLEPFGNYPAPHYVDYVLTKLMDILTEKHSARGLDEKAARQKAAELVYGGGLEIYTALDTELQEAAEQAVADNLDSVFPMEEEPFPQAASVVLDVETGKIRALVGGRTHEKMLDFNAAWQAYRQPGSAFKPIAVYAPAFDLGYTPATVVDDAPVVYEIGPQRWTPMNYDEEFLGLTTLREAVRRSVNAVAVRVLDQIGIEKGVEYAQKLGIESLVVEEGPRTDNNLSLALGGLTKGVTPLEMARAYNTFANGGVRTTPYAIRKVVDSDGNVIIDRSPQLDVVLAEQTAYIMTDVLRSVVESQPANGWLENWGTGVRANDSEVLAKWPVAGKTGTTNDVKDIWFVGYTPKYVTAVWMGYYNPPRRIPGGQGGKWPAMIWRDTMTAAHKELEPSSFERPEGITTAQICIKSGLLAGEHCWPGYRRTELFAEDTRPTEVGNDFVAVNVMEVPEEALEEHPEFIEEYPCLQWNRWVEHDEECYGPHEGKFMYNRPPVDFEEVKQAAKIYYRGGYSLNRALRLVPRDALTMVPTVSCTDLPGVFEEPEPEPTEPIQGEEAEYNLEITDHLFKPMLLTIYKGQVAHLHITNTGEKKHNFSIDVLGIDVDVEPNETVVVDLQADNEGIYRFYDKHGSSRMKQGRLLVKVPEQVPEEETTP